MQGLKCKLFTRVRNDDSPTSAKFFTGGTTFQPHKSLMKVLLDTQTTNYRVQVQRVNHAVSGYACELS